MTSRINTTDDIGRRIAKNVLHKFFTTQSYPYTKHHIDSYDQFLSTDLAAIFRAKNPIRNVKDYIEGQTNKYVYNVEIYVGGINGDDIEIGTPVVNLDQSNDVRLMFPNEARLRNLTYASEVKVGITVNITYNEVNPDKTITPHTQSIDFKGIRLFKIPIMLHSRYCQLHDKPSEFLTEVGECPYDYGGYFIVDGAEKILIGRQEQAFNTLYVTKQDKDEKISVYANVTSLSPETRKIEFVSFSILRKNNVIYVTLPMVRAPINVFVLFRALGIQSDEAIVKMIFPDLDAADAKFMADKLVPTIIDAYPFTTTVLAVQYIKTLTKGFSVATVLDILRNRLFTHVLDKPGARATYLAECIRQILKVNYEFENSTNRDDVRNSRCLTSGFLVQDLFSNSYKDWIKAIRRAIDEEYNYHKTLYSGTSFANIFSEGNRTRIFKEGFITDLLFKGFKGKWGSGLGEDKTGVLQALSRLSYIDFMSHCRRVVLDFDTGQKLVGPRQLNTSQYGYFCTNETPSGASIGITKNLTVLATISTGMQPGPLVDWLMTRGGVLTCEEVTAEQKSFFVPVSINNGIIGYTSTPLILLKVLKAFKHTGFLPPFIGVGFSYNQRRLFIYTDEGRPLRPLIMIDADHKVPIEKIASLKTWRQLLMGTHPARVGTDVSTSLFKDPFDSREGRPTAEDYLRELEPYSSVIEYIDPYEHNEILVANYPEHINQETTHMEIHPSTILSAITTLIPFANHNQSPRNQLGDSQSKQSISIYATNWQNRFDNSGHISCYGDGPLARTIYYDYLGEGKLPYGNNVILAIATHGGYNRDDGFVINKSSLERGLFRTIAYRSYEFFEEDDETTGLKKRIGNPANIGSWLDLRPGLNYLKLDDRGIIKVGEYVDEDTVIVGGYYQLEKGKYKDASLTPKVWTRGIVESVNVTVNNKGLRLVKIRVVQDRVPELGDKFCLTPEHDVLTSTGWKSIAKITEDDFVCSLNANSEIEYSKPTGMYSFNCQNEDLYHISSQQVELITTLNHKMYVKPRGSQSYSLLSAKDIHKKRVQYKKNGINKNAEFIIQLDNVNKFQDDDAFLEFLGYWISDGWVYTRKDGELRIELSLGLKKDMIHVSNLIKQMGYNSYSNTQYNKLFITSKSLGTYLKTFSNGATNKVLPDWVWNLSERQCRVLLRGLIGGDGTITNTGSEKFFTTSVLLADQIQRLSLHAGWSGNKKKIMEAGTKITIKGIQTKLNADYWCISIIKNKNEPMVNHGHTKTQNGQSETIIKYNGAVYCIEVPSHVFYVRYNGKCTWTGNSNRHGQKGTIGAIVPSVDLPRTKDGIVPDIISNPLAIPSRMTMAMILESLLGKAAACHGAIGDATTFMNDGNPAEAIGNILESQYGFEKYGNEILYDGTTGKQLKVAIFMGPTYYMRLKHMVEDKWQARTTGRREAKTHQPTGGRGNEGGIRFGELERDTVVTHGAIGFLRETLMKRSDGVEMPICTGCGTVPIYNKKLNIAVCPLCQGPLKYAGNSTDNLEMIPPTHKQTAPIIQVEMPYCLKVLEQELATYGNMSMRFIPTTGFQKIANKNTLIVPTGNNSQMSQMLPEFKIPEIDVPELMNPESSDLSTEKPVPNLQDLASLAKSVGMTLVPENSAMTRELTGIGPLGVEDAESPAAKEARAAANEKIVEGSMNEEEALVAPDDEEEVQILPGAIPPTPALKVYGSKAPSAQSPRVVEPMPMMTPEQMASVLVNTAIQQPQVFAAAANQANQAMIPTGPTVIVDTSPRAMMAEGLIPEPRANPAQGDTGLRIARRKPRAQAPAAVESNPMANSRVMVNKMG